MIGHCHERLVITTGNFTKMLYVRRRDGAPTIDLVTGIRLNKLRAWLGRVGKLVQLEEVEIDGDWFATLTR